MRIVIVGAGLAGLSAAHALAGSGADVRVFEAQERLGGRVLTWRDAPVAPFHAELGGEFIDGDHQAIRGLCRQFRLPLVQVLEDGFGLAIGRGRKVRLLKRQTPLWKRYAAHFRAHAGALRAVKLDLASSAAATIAATSVTEVLRKARASYDVRALATGLRNLYAADPEAMSALMTALEIESGGDPSTLTMYRVRNGNERLVEALAAAGRATIRTRHIVRSVLQNDRGVELTVEGPRGGRSTISADFVILAVPLPLLREIELTPALPPAQQRAFQTLSMGPATKAVLRYSAPWWRKSGKVRASGSNLPVGAVWDGSEGQRGAALLTLLAGGNASSQLRHLLNRRSPPMAEHLRWFNGGTTEAPAVHFISWELDRWARGAYEFLSPRFDPALQPLLGRAFRRVLFAGGHTSREHPGYMNGAVQSGQRAAREIQQLARLPIPSTS